MKNTNLIHNIICTTKVHVNLNRKEVIFGSNKFILEFGLRHLHIKSLRDIGTRYFLKFVLWWEKKKKNTR
jgi:hypothetical protein